jgi:hypothetical protein
MRFWNIPKIKPKTLLFHAVQRFTSQRIQPQTKKATQIKPCAESAYVEGVYFLHQNPIVKMGHAAKPIGGTPNFTSKTQCKNCFGKPPYSAGVLLL